MEDTGRIVRVLTATARRIVFGTTADAAIDAELWAATEVDLAHLLVLAEEGLVPPQPTRELLSAVRALRQSDFQPLRGRPAPRGLYLLYEDHLIGRLGARTGGLLQLGRSRNDVGATTLRIRLREPYRKLLRETMRLEAVLLRRARRFADVVMPAYTHYQAAVPVTYGHYLAGVAAAFGRDAAAILVAGADLDRCPLGAGAVGGTSVPIVPLRAAELLGFSVPIGNSIDAVASRDGMLRLVAAAAILGLTLSRLATDLLLWSTEEFGFVQLPDELVGSSSMMPQKRNPFLLEHVKGRSASALGALVAAAMGVHASPFSNSVAVGTEAARFVAPALFQVAEATSLARLVVAGVRPVAERMRERAEEGLTTATELATRLAMDGGMDFRSAHHQIGALVTKAIASGVPFAEVVARWAEATGRVIAPLDPASVVGSARYGGGPGTLLASLDVLESDWLVRRALARAQTRQWTSAAAALDAAVARWCAAECVA